MGANGHCIPMKPTSPDDPNELGTLSRWLCGLHAPHPTPEYELLKALVRQEAARLALRDALSLYSARPDGDMAGLTAMLADCTHEDDEPVALPDWLSDRLAALQGIPSTVMQAAHRAGRQL